jgi:hypothetical protein
VNLSSSLRFAFLLAILPGALHAASITGTVTNKTTNKPSAGDEVVLIRLQQGMQESTRTKTDSKGHFTLNVPDADGIHLVRVTHDKANYFRPAPPGTDSVELDVYNAAAKVPGVTGEANVIEMQTDPSGSSLRVVENFFVKNDSKPPRTQFSDKPFEFYLPTNAVVEGSAALAPGGMPVQAAPVPLGDPGHYTFIFPIRPGETRFQITFHVPYNGSYTFTPKEGLKTDTIALMMPKSMSFKPVAGSPFNPVAEETNAQTYVARGVDDASPLGFTVSGTGQLPRDTLAAAAPGAAGQPGAAGASGAETPEGQSAPSSTKFGGGLGPPVDPGAANDPWAKYKWWILSGLALALAAAAGIYMKGSSGTAPEAEADPDQRSPGPRSTGYAANTTATTPAPHRPGDTLSALKEELFALETERLQGTLNEDDYLAQKQALETVLKRALARGSGAQAGVRS